MGQFQEVRLQKCNIGNVTWYTQAGNITTKKKYILKVLNIKQFIQSMLVTAIFHMFDKPLVPGTTSSYEGFKTEH